MHNVCPSKLDIPYLITPVLAPPSNEYMLRLCSVFAPSLLCVSNISFQRNHDEVAVLAPQEKDEAAKHDLH